MDSVVMLFFTFCVVILGLWVPLIFVYVSPRVRNARIEPWSGAFKAALVAGIVATIISTQYGDYNSGGGLCVGCGGSGGFLQGYPLPWWGLEAVGIFIILAPLTLALDLWFWIIIAFLVLLPLRCIVLQLLPRLALPFWILFAASLFAFVPFMVPYLDHNAKIVSVVQARMEHDRAQYQATEQARQAEYDARIRRDAPLANNAIRFLGCRDHLGPSEKYPEIMAIQMEITIQVLNPNGYVFQASTSEFHGGSGDITYQNGARTVHINLIPRSISVGLHTEQLVEGNGPYTVNVQLEQIDSLNDAKFDYQAIARARELGILNSNAISFTCKTAPYKKTDFGPPFGTFPRTPVPTRTPTPNSR